LLAERSDKSVVLLDAKGRIRVMSASIEQALDWRVAELIGRSWAEQLSPESRDALPRGWLARVRRGTLRAAEWEVLTRSGERARVSLDLAPMGDGADGGILLTLTHVAPRVLADDNDDAEYEIDTSPERFGTMRWRSGDARAVVRPDERCYRVYFGRLGPCTDCPVLEHDAWPRTSVRVMLGPPQSYAVTSARELAPGVARVHRLRLSEALLARVQQAKVRALATSANLTARERDVLALLVLGRSNEEIAASLDVTPRTVKFHQANVFEKLGAESRADLIRLVTF
jgi:PAS domain S-box-containing protein